MNFLNIDNYISELKKYDIYNEDIDKIIEAYEFATMAHQGQFRKSGEPFIIHPITVSLIIAEWRLESDLIIAGLLHDVIEDTFYSYEDISEKFGVHIAILVDGVTKLDKVKYTDKEVFQADNLRKMILAMAKDVRVILIKLADRLHNMRTLQFQREDRKKPIAQETLEIYAPFAHKLGMFQVKMELEDLCLYYLDNEKYLEIEEKVNKKNLDRHNNIEKIIEILKKALLDFNIEYIDIYGRAKNYYSIYKKMVIQKKLFSELYDVIAVRIIVKDIKDCYGALGVVHSLWSPIPNRFKDYIATPKPNMYQSLHTTVLSNLSSPFEIQIRTEEMHQIAEYGIAAHFKYKHKNSTDSKLYDTLTLIGQIFEQEQESATSLDYLNNVKYELNSELIYVFTPQGKVIELPKGATPIDFAYKIHSDIGNKCIGAKVDGRIVPLNFELENGKIVEIITSKASGGPSRDWLKFVKSNQTKNKIKQWFKKERHEENVEKGKEILDREIIKNGFKIKDFLNSEYLNIILHRLSLSKLEDLYAAVGYGGILTNQVIPKLRELVREKQKEKEETIINNDNINVTKKKRKKSNNGIIVEGLDETDIRIAKCCNPVPGDNIIGFITRGRGITIHQINCSNLETSEESRNRYIEVSWSSNKLASYEAGLELTVDDRKGILAEIAVLPSSLNISLNSINSRKLNTGMVIINIVLEINSKNELEKIIAKFKQIKGVISVKRF